MELVTFNTYEQYLRLQRRSARAKRWFPFFTWLEIKRIAEWVTEHKAGGVGRIVCHGARSGLECDEFKKHFPEAEAFGTDLCPYLGLSDRAKGVSPVVEHDFSVQRAEWITAFDLVYSNSLSHAVDPARCLTVWLEQLRPGGVLALQWDYSAMGRVGGSDVFACDVGELARMVDKAGKFLDVLWVDCPWEKRGLLARKALRVFVVIGGNRP